LVDAARLAATWPVGITSGLPGDRDFVAPELLRCGADVGNPAAVFTTARA
jgi:hypothetical protein